MKIQGEIICMPYEKALLPGLLLDIKISYLKYKEAISGVNGWIMTEDGTILSEVGETIPDETRPVIHHEMRLFP